MTASSNCTNVNGTLVRFAYTIPDPQQTTVAADAKYDHRGAMQFIIVTVILYSTLGVFCVLINRIKQLRGKSQQNHMHDEGISRYLKNEEKLKADGRKMKLLYECELIADRVMFFEEKQKLVKLEKGLTPDVVNDRYSKGGQIRNHRTLTHDNGSTLGKLGASLFYIGSDAPLLSHSTPRTDDSEIVQDDKCEDAHAPDDCIAVDVHLIRRFLNEISETEQEERDYVDTDNERKAIRPKVSVTRV